MRALVRNNFVVAAGLCFALWVSQFAGLSAHLQAVRAAYGPFAAKVALAPLALAFLQVVFWFRFYRFGGRLARLGAGIFGVVFVLIVLKLLLGQSVSTEETLGMSVALYSYFGASHFAYALSGARDGDA